MFGNGLSGVSLNLLRLIFVISFPPDSLYLQAQIFFIIAGIVLLICGAAFTVLNKNEFFIHYKKLG